MDCTKNKQLVAVLLSHYLLFHVPYFCVISLMRNTVRLGNVGLVVEFTDSPYSAYSCAQKVQAGAKVISTLNTRLGFLSLDSHVKS